MCKQSVYHAMKGLLLASLSGVLMSAAFAIVKYLKYIHPIQHSLYRATSMVVFVLPELAKSQTIPFQLQGLHLPLLLNGFLFSACTILPVFVVQYLPLGEGSAIMGGTPVFVIISAHFILNEPWTKSHTVLACSTFIGIVFLSGLPENFTRREFQYDKETIYGFIAAILMLFARSSRFVILRKLKTVPSSLIIVSMGSITAVLMDILVFTFFGKITLLRCGMDRYLALAYCFLTNIVTLCITLAFKYDLAGQIAIARATSEVITAFAIQVLFFKDIPSIWSIIGALIVTLSTIVLSVNKMLSSLPANSPLKRSLNFLC